MQNAETIQKEIENLNKNQKLLQDKRKNCNQRRKTQRVNRNDFFAIYITDKRLIFFIKTSPRN